MQLPERQSSSRTNAATPQIIEAAGAKFACDTCMAVAPLKGRFKSLATTSAKGCFYSRQNLMKTKMGSIEECVAGGGDWEMEQLKGRIIYKGKAEGEALVTSQPISFYGGVDPNTGVVIEKGHELQGQSVKGKILVFPTGKGSTVGSYTLYRMKKNGTAPAGMINRECETVVAVGAIISEIPCVDKIEISKIKTGEKIQIENDCISALQTVNPVS